MLYHAGTKCTILEVCPPTTAISPALWPALVSGKSWIKLTVTHGHPNLGTLQISHSKICSSDSDHMLIHIYCQTSVSRPGPRKALLHQLHSAITSHPKCVTSQMASIWISDAVASIAAPLHPHQAKQQGCPILHAANKGQLFSVHDVVKLV